MGNYAAPRFSKHKVFLILEMLIICTVTISAAISLIPVKEVGRSPVVMGEEMSLPQKPEAPTAPTHKSDGTFDFSQPVPENTPVDDTYFQDAVFIGNSITEGLFSYGILKDTTVFAHTGLSINEVFDKPVIKTPDGKVSVITALSQRQFGKVYIMLGMNELGWRAHKIFIDDYEKFIDEVRRLQPNAVIYVSSILPVTQKRDDTDAVFTNANVDIFNGHLKTVCTDKSVYFLDCGKGIMDENSKMPADGSPDGVHMNKATYQKWLEYVKSHTI